MNREEFNQKIADCREDAIADGHDLGDCACDLADCLLSDPEFFDYSKKRFISSSSMLSRNTIKGILKELIADRIYE